MEAASRKGSVLNSWH